MEDYAEKPETVIPELFRFIGEPAENIDTNMMNVKKNTGVKSKPVLPETTALLDQFFEPFNDELADMLGEEKWKFLRN